jgi:RimJ/RimL family protein N-acetyltransferase
VTDPAPTLDGPRIELRPIDMGDLAGIAALHGDARVTRLLVDGIPDTVEKAAIFVRWNEPLRAAGMGTFAVRRHGSAELIGLFSLAPFDPDPARLEFGGRLRPDNWRGGIAAEASRIMIDHGFDALDREDLVSAFDPANRSAAAVLTRLGFRAEGAGALFGRPVSIMSLRRDDWRSALAEEEDPWSGPM